MLPILKLTNIQKKYEDGFIAIQNFNLEIDKGEFVTLLGPSGCGKTTILKIIGGFEQVTKGKILYNGIDIKDLDIVDRPTSTVFQDYALFPNMTVEQNIKYGLRLMRTPLDDVPNSVYQLADKVYAEASKLKKRKIKELEKQRKTLKTNIDKLEKKYNKNPYLLSIKDYRRPQYLAELNILYDKLDEAIDNGFECKFNFKEWWKEKMNSFFAFMKINKRYKIDWTTRHPIEQEIYELKKWYRAKKPTDDKLDKLVEKYNDLDYWVSYWETYPTIKKEAFEKKNITRKLNKDEIQKRCDDVIELIGLKGKEKSFPSDLSGGMQQRVALARSIVIEPEIILLDEPLSALDAKVRQQLQVELKRLHKELGITFILVTHDQEEALMLSDKVVVMSNGKIEQIGKPEDIYDTPENLWVANFVGKANIYEMDEEHQNFYFCNINFDLDIKYPDESEKDKYKVWFMVRPEDFTFVEDGLGQINNVFVKSVNYTGLFYDVTCEFQDTVIHIKSITNIPENTYVGINLVKENIHTIYERVEE